MPGLPANQPRLLLANAVEWAQWLAREAETSDGIWLFIARKGCSKPTSLTSEQALDEALCYGWIDGQCFKGDETTLIRRYCPRRPKSLWSKRNTEHISRLEREGRMQPRGWLEVEKAKKDGRWDAAYSQANMEAPADLVAAIAAVPDAQAQWDILTKQNKFAICFRLANLKTKAGRDKRLEADVDMLARGETVHPQKQKRERTVASSRSTKSKPSIARASSTSTPQRRSKRLRTSTTNSK